MRELFVQQVFLLLILSLGFVSQCASTIVYRCKDESDVCGCSKRSNIILKIGGGESAVSNKWDWVVSLRVSNEHFCGGSILNEWYIITAAHCLENRTHLISKMTACGGTFRLSDSCEQRRMVDSIISHPLYDTKTLENDIALIRLATPFNFSDSLLTPICLSKEENQSKYLAVGTRVVAIGWGGKAKNDSSNELNQVTLKIMNKSSIYCSHIDNDQLQMCAGDYGKGISYGDSGGPLMVLTASKRWELVGISSFTKKNANSNTGSGFTFITPFIEFIQTHTKELSTYPTTIKRLCYCPQTSRFNIVHILQNSTSVCANTSQGNFIYDSGDTYEGQNKDGKKHGRGTYNYKSGNQYFGDWIDDKKTGQGVFTWVRGDKYIGDWFHDKKMGYGVIHYLNDGVYMGEFKDDTFHGQGIYQWFNGNRYQGNWIADNREGHGAMSWSNGDNYTGDWTGGRRAGKGFYMWKSGDKYEGQFKDALMHGKGTYYFSNGNKYEGDWIDNRRTGIGVMNWPSGAKYQGGWLNDTREGHGVMSYSNGNNYTGGWTGDRMTGKGVYMWKNGARYAGQFKDNNMHGKGTCYFSNGNKYEGDWIDNSRTGNGVFRWESGDKYEGQFKDDDRHGRGTYYYFNGTKYVADWIYNMKFEEIHTLESKEMDVSENEYENVFN